MKLKEIALSIYYEPYVYGMDSNNYSSKEEYLNDSRNFFHEVLFPIKKQFIMETRNIASFLVDCILRTIKTINILLANLLSAVAGTNAVSVELLTLMV